MNQTDRINSLTPSTCWDTYVGNQTVAEFLLDVDADIADEVARYVRLSPVCQDLSDDAREALAAKLVEYINAAGFGTL